MSGPTSISYTITPLTTLVNSTVKSIAGNFARARELEARYLEKSSVDTVEIAKQKERLQNTIISAERQYSLLLDAVEQYQNKPGQTPTQIPTLPKNTLKSVDALRAHANALQAGINELQAILLVEAAKNPTSEFSAELTIACNSDDVTGALAPSLTASQVDNKIGRARQQIDKLLQQLARFTVFPEDIQQLLCELRQIETPSQALIDEIIYRVQQFAENEQKEQLQRAASRVAEQTLRDLGYQIEGIEETLFVEGGVAHFRKRSWGDYAVRMRVTPDSQQINLNVVRAVDDVVTAKAAGTLRADHIAEDRWCAEFPALQNALAAQGIQSHILRQLHAGGVPVQLVDKQYLPKFSEEEDRSISSEALRTLPIPKK